MTELEAGRAETLAPVRSGVALQRYRDVLIALIAFAVLASLPLFTGSSTSRSQLLASSIGAPDRSGSFPANQLPGVQAW